MGRGALFVLILGAAGQATCPLPGENGVPLVTLLPSFGLHTLRLCADGDVVHVEALNHSHPRLVLEFNVSGPPIQAHFGGSPGEAQAVKQEHPRMRGQGPGTMLEGSDGR